MDSHICDVHPVYVNMRWVASPILPTIVMYSVAHPRTKKNGDPKGLSYSLLLKFSWLVSLTYGPPRNVALY